MFCTQCGAQIPEGSAFCTNCGAPVNPPAEQQSASASQQSPNPVPPAQGPTFQPAVAPTAPTTAAPAGPQPSASTNEFVRLLQNPLTYQNAGIVAGLTMAGALIGLVIVAPTFIFGLKATPASSLLNDLNTFQLILNLLVMGFGGSLHMSISGAFSFGTSGDGALPISLVGLFAFVGAYVGVLQLAKHGMRFKASTKEEKKNSYLRCGLVLAIAGLFAGIFTSIVAAISVMHPNSAVSLSSASARSFFNPLFIILAGGSLGFVASQYAGSLVSQCTAALKSLRFGLRTFVETTGIFFAVFTVFTIIAFVILSIIGKTAAWFLFLPLIGPFIGMSLTAMGSLGSVSLMGVSLSLFHRPDGQPAISIALFVSLLLVLVCTAYASLRLAKRMAIDPQEREWKHSWKAPLYSAVLWGFLAICFAPVSVSMGGFGGEILGGLATLGSSSSYSPTASNGITPAMIIIGAVWAFAIEALARLVFLHMFNVTPAVAGQPLAQQPVQPAAAGQPIAAGQPGVTPAQAAAAAAAPADVTPAAVQAAPAMKVNKKVVIPVAITVGVLALVGIGGSIAITVIDNTRFSPMAVAESYTNAIAAGNFEQANAMAVSTSKMSGPLISNAVGKKAQRPTNFRLSENQTSGENRSITVKYDLDGHTKSNTITLQKTGTTGIFFSKWEVKDQLKMKLSIWHDEMLSDTATVNGAKVKADGKPYEAYPAVYTASVKNTKWVESKPVKVTPENNEVVFEYTPSSAVKEAVQQALNQAIDEVVKHPTDKDGYEWLDTGWYSWSSDFYSNVKATVKKYPTIGEISVEDNEFKAELKDKGKIHYEYDYSFLGDTDHDQTDNDIDFGWSSSINFTVDKNGKITFDE
ncbi:MAG TPA: zinc ribbon domain-containing protein [Aeriscardovia aeriphila]|uniref:Zinc ribbon domain-containing protein n=1 Tax=Aeriscardovia aeriphila TaxID=218139 RepID=A0A921KA14_9BIFI|nr:zinc ribbon domain-containing protein [Aeriscardovia aeriphila]